MGRGRLTQSHKGSMKKAFLIVILLLLIFSQSHEPVFQQVVLEKSAYVFLLHGLARSSRSMGELENSLLSHGYRVIKVDYPSTEHPIEYLADEILSDVIEQYSKAVQTKIHFVTHSMGGIVVRYYLKHHDLPNLGRIVMLSPPNQGSELVDRLRGNFIFKKCYGPAGQQLGTAEGSILVSLGPVDFELGVITGTRSFNPISSVMIPGPDDGVVSVARAKVSGMTDFLTIPQSHAFIVHNQEVIDQVIHFLENGEFRHKAPEKGGQSIH